MLILKQNAHVYVVNITGDGITMEQCVKLAFQNEMERREFCALDDSNDVEIPEDVRCVSTQYRQTTRMEVAWNSLWKALLPKLARDERLVEDADTGHVVRRYNRRGSSAWYYRVAEIRAEMYRMAGGCEYACEYVDELMRVYLNFDE